MSKIHDQAPINDANGEVSASDISPNPDLASSMAPALESGPEPIVVDPVG